ncbi:esterase/lipase family protein [Tundrisphaera lichenicola]|uniref:esterase/lipase family protein n=1 Tax=Tundrisphaera lichenicola TaxID=2029860 RepID=UPI003EBA8B70
MMKDKESDPASDQAPHPHYVITLVHGTFAPRARWTQDGSLLREVLKERLVASSTVFETFRWTGGNSHFDRIKAGLAFRKFFRELSAKYPESKHVIVAHSHGGNVVLYGLRRTRSQGHPNLNAIVFLATPFIRPEEIDIKKNSRYRGFSGQFAAIGTLVFALMLTIAVPVALMGLSGNGPSGSQVKSLLYLILVAATYTGSIKLWLKSRRDFRPGGPEFQQLARSQARLARFLSGPRVAPAPLLAVSTQGDEAMLVLETTNSVDSTGIISIKAISCLWFLGSIGMAALLGRELWALVYDFKHLPPPGERHDFGAGPLIIIFFILVELVVLLVVIATIFFIPTFMNKALDHWRWFSMGMGYGRGPTGSHNLFRVNPELRPPGDISCEKLVVTTRSPWYSKVLRHSALYNDRTALTKIAEWVASITDRQSL